MKNIIMYTSNTCPHCKAAKEFLTKEGYKFTAKEITNNPTYQQELTKLGARGVPTFVIEEEVIIGFNKEKIIRLLDYKVMNCPACNKRMRIPKNKGKIKATCPKCHQNFIIKT